MVTPSWFFGLAHPPIAATVHQATVRPCRKNDRASPECLMLNHLAQVFDGAAFFGILPELA